MKLRERYSSENIRWNSDQRRFKYETKSRIIPDEEENEEDRYDGNFDWINCSIDKSKIRRFRLGLDPDYVAYLKARRQKEKEVQIATNAEQTKSKNFRFQSNFVEEKTIVSSASHVGFDEKFFIIH